ncbi:MAG: hypothetical protein NT057_01085 [Actinobacteria bacterium]|nr:hypothetical protein [Actinomycetota bacterium]
MNLLQLGSASLVTRLGVALLGIVQLKLAMPFLGISGFADVAGSLIFLSVGNIFESALSWRLRFEVARIGNTSEAKKITSLQAFQNSKILVPFAVGTGFTSFVIESEFIANCLSVVSLISLSLIFVPWVRFLEGIGKQKINIAIQFSCAIIVFLIFLMYLSNLTTTKMVLISSSFPLFCSSSAFVYCYFMKVKQDISPLSSDNLFQGVSVTGFQSFIIISSSTLLFGIFPLLSHWMQTDLITAQNGVEVRLLSLGLGVIAVISTQVQVERIAVSKKSILKTDLRLITLAGCIFLGFPVVDWIAQKYFLGSATEFLLINSVPYGLLLGFVILQIPSATISLVDDGGRLQMYTYFASGVLFIATIFAIANLNISFVWASCFSFLICHMIPIVYKYHGK